MSVSLDQCTPTGVPRHTGAPRGSLRCAAKLLNLPAVCCIRLFWWGRFCLLHFSH